jgi:hypothetical protein
VTGIFISIYLFESDVLFGGVSSYGHVSVLIIFFSDMYTAICKKQMNDNSDAMMFEIILVLVAMKVRSEFLFGVWSISAIDLCVVILFLK